MKILIACVDMISQNLGRQPWFYMNTIGAGLVEEGHEVWFLTDKQEGCGIYDGRHIVFPHFRSFPAGIDRDLIPILCREKFDLLFWSTGLTDFLFRSRIDLLGLPVIAVVTSPRYSLKELMSFGKAIFLEWALLKQLFISPFIGEGKIRSFLRLHNLKAVVFECQDTLTRYVRDPAERGKCVVIPPLVPEEFLNLLRTTRYEKEGTSPKILYVGPPLHIRGVDTVIRALSEVRKSVANVRLEILSRIENEELRQHESSLRRLITRYSLNGSVAIVSGLLDREEIVEHMSCADVICLPFKGVISEVPIVVLEALASGTRLITTSVAGVAEFAKHVGCQIVPPGDPHALATAISAALSEAERRGEHRPDRKAFLHTHGKSAFAASLKLLIQEVA